MKRMNKITKKIFTVIMSAVCVLSLLSGTACTNTKVVEDYPAPVVQVTDTDEDNQDVTTDKDNKEPEEEPLDEVLLPEYDSLREKGVFEFNPVAINPIFKEEMKNNPKIVKVAKLILQSVYDCETEFTLSEELACTEAEFGLAQRLAALSNPMVEAVRINTTDNENFTIVYFPTYTRNDDMDLEMDEGVGPDEARKLFEDFENLTKELVNERITDKDDDMQRAAKIYKSIIENLELDLHDEEEENVDQETDPIIESMEAANFNIIETINSRELTYWCFLEYYQFCLVQLNVKCMLVGSSGQYQSQNVPKLDEIASGNTGWAWAIIFADEKSYHADMLMDKILLDYQRESFDGYESDMKYFGMGDEKREESFKIYYIVSVESLNPVNQQKVPQCEEDYKLEL